MLFSVDVTNPILTIVITKEVAAALIYGLLAFIVWRSVWKLIVTMCDEYIDDDVSYGLWIINFVVIISSMIWILYCISRIVELIL